MPQHKAALSLDNPLTKMRPSLCVTLLCGIIFAFPATGTLKLWSAGRHPRELGPLLDGDRICWKHYPTGISVGCEAGSAVKKALFYVNNVKVKREKTWPFFIKGDNYDIGRATLIKVKPWLAFPESAEIRCELSTGEVFTADVTFACDDEKSEPSPEPSDMAMVNESPQPPPAESAETENPATSPLVDMTSESPEAMEATAEAVPTESPGAEESVMVLPSMSPGMGRGPGTMMFVEANHFGGVGPILEDGLVFCPRDAFESGELTIFCEGLPTGVGRAIFFVDDAEARTEGSEPYYIAGDIDGIPKRWSPPNGWFTVRCELSNGASKKSARVKVECEPTGTPDGSDDGGNFEKYSQLIEEEGGCVLMGAKISPYERPWTPLESGLIFKGKLDTLSIAKEGAFPLYYTFTARITSRYAVVLDMTTAHSREHNDVYVRFQGGGLALTRRGVLRFGGTGWLKVYHNDSGRSIKASSVDKMAHSISTMEELIEGQEYTLEVGGRSTKVLLHRAIVFPCGDGFGSTTCQRGDHRWKKFIARCAEPLTP